MKKPETKNILVSVPVPLLKKLEASAKAQMRSRTAEIRIRLAESLKAQKTGRVERAGEDRRSASSGG